MVPGDEVYFRGQHYILKTSSAANQSGSGLFPKAYPRGISMAEQRLDMTDKPR